MKDSSPPRLARLRGIWRSDVSIAAQKYFLVGGLSAIMEWAVFAMLLYWLDLHYLVSGACSFVLVTGANYFLSVRYVFGTGQRARGQRIFLLYLVSTIGVIFNLGVLAIGIDLIGMHEMAAKLLATGAVFGWNFSARYFFVFKK